MTYGDAPHRLIVRMTDGSSIIKDFPNVGRASEVLGVFTADPGKISILRFNNHDGTIFHVNPNNIAFIGVVRSDTCDLVDRFTLVEPRR